MIRLYVIHTGKEKERERHENTPQCKYTHRSSLHCNTKDGEMMMVLQQASKKKDINKKRKSAETIKQNGRWKEKNET